MWPFLHPSFFLTPSWSVGSDVNKDPVLVLQGYGQGHGPSRQGQGQGQGLDLQEQGQELDPQ